MNPVFAILDFADPIVSLPPDAFQKREPVHLRSAITGKIGSPLTIRQPQVELVAGMSMLAKPHRLSLGGIDASLLSRADLPMAATRV